MIGKLLEKRSIQAGLALVVLLVWGYNMMKIADLSTGEAAADGSIELTIAETTPNIPGRMAYEYRGDFHDPFRPYLVLRRQQTVAIEPEPQTMPVELPQFSLTGVIEKTAMLQNPQSQTVYFAVKGDTLEGARIISIATDSVIMIYKSKTFTVRFQ